MPTVDEMIRRYHAGEYDFVSKKDAGLLVAEIERLREDEKRLDFIESRYAHVTYNYVNPHSDNDHDRFTIDLGTRYGPGRGDRTELKHTRPRLREAIDAARAQEQTDG